MNRGRRLLVGFVAIVAGAAIAAVTLGRHPQASSTLAEVRPTSAVDAGTSRSELERLSAELETRLAATPLDGSIAEQLTEVLLRLARVEANGGYTARAERLLTELLRQEPDDYNALRALGAVRLSQHRFRLAIEVAERASRIRPGDAWNFGVRGDAHLELGEYDQAFDAFDTMMALRPNAAAYARVAYAHELQGRFPEALRAMTMATEATGARDIESQAWHRSQLGLLYIQMGQLDDAEREFDHADFLFPRHPYARLGRARLLVARGDHDGALRVYESMLSDAPTSEAALAAAELLAHLGRLAEADAMFTRAEALERDAWRTEVTQPANLARILAERGVRLDEAVRLAEDAASSRTDIFTMDALAWSYYKVGRVGEARAASTQARRTGTRDARILTHAAAIDAAVAE
ncbi:MAG: tetratricopeptide repeat protein [Vicinamibacterales bacterium]